MRELAPVVRLSREDIVVIGRFSHVSAALSDWRTFSSQSRPWHDPSSVRPDILLTDDPPRHTEVRVVIANALSPKALNRMAQAFAKEAEFVVERVLAMDGGFDAVSAICRPFVYKVLPDLLGLPEPGREHMEAFGHMVWATMGPMNELFHEAMVGNEPVLRGSRSVVTGKTLIRTGSEWRCFTPRIAATSHRPRPSCSSRFCFGRGRYHGDDARHRDSCVLRIS